MVYNIGCKNGLNSNWGGLAAANECGDIEVGVGTPAHSSPIQTLYIKVNATPGTSSIYRNSDGAGTWAANSDD